jgi:hypothetical protein
MRSAPETPPAAEYLTNWKRIQEKPDVNDAVQVNIRNTGPIRWLARGSGRVAVGYKWWRKGAPEVEKGSLVTPLPHNVEPGETVALSIPFRTPDDPGMYLLILDLFVRKFDWFSNAGVKPGLIDADIQPGISRFVQLGEMTSIQPIIPDQPGELPVVARPMLWRAAIDLFRAHPFGVGPDNYRLLYGRFLGLTAWNTKTYSNSLYLELLTGSGILGLAAFVFILVSIPRSGAAPYLMAVAIFLIHGFVDVFLMTTPIYFSFWILLGMCCRSGEENVMHDIVVLR